MTTEPNEITTFAVLQVKHNELVNKALSELRIANESLRTLTYQLTRNVLDLTQRIAALESAHGPLDPSEWERRSSNHLQILKGLKDD